MEGAESSSPLGQGKGTREAEIYHLCQRFCMETPEESVESA